jgi:hypothetical protein
MQDLSPMAHSLPMQSIRTKLPTGRLRDKTTRRVWGLTLMTVSDPIIPTEAYKGKTRLCLHKGSTVCSGDPDTAPY